jgi:hypothetical protein
MYSRLPNRGPGATYEDTKRLREIWNRPTSWAIVDADKSKAVSLAQYHSFIPAAKTHAQAGNTLDFDWHVEAVKDP